jgi:hypothetical protein
MPHPLEAQGERRTNSTIAVLGFVLIAAGCACLLVPQIYPSLAGLAEPGAFLAGVLLTSGVRLLAGAFKPADNSDEESDSGKIIFGNVSGGSIHISTYDNKSEEGRKEVTLKPAK